MAKLVSLIGSRHFFSVYKKALTLCVVFCSIFSWGVSQIVVSCVTPIPREPFGLDTFDRHEASSTLFLLQYSWVCIWPASPIHHTYNIMYTHALWCAHICTCTWSKAILGQPSWWASPAILCRTWRAEFTTVMNSVVPLSTFRDILDVNILVRANIKLGMPSRPPQHR